MPPGPVATGKADASSAAPREVQAPPAKDRPRRMRATTTVAATAATTEREAMTKKKHEANSGDALRVAVLKALGASDGDLHTREALLQFMGDRKVTSIQLTSALMHLKNRGLAEFEGRGRGIQWRITRAGAKALENPDGPLPKTGAPKGSAKPKRKKKEAAPRRRRAARRSPATPPVVEDRDITSSIAASSINSTAEAGVPIASFTSKGEILLTHAGATRLIGVAESRAVIELVRAFDDAGLLPRDAPREVASNASAAGIASTVLKNAARIKRALARS
jgi:hypothetical protein